MNPRVLYIDGFNLFQANYRSNIAQDSNGEPIGGFLGTLIQIRNLVYKFSPQKVFVVFDGPEAGLRRRMFCKEYKSKRPAKKRSASVKLDDKEYVTIDNETEQLQKLFNVLKILPIQLVSIPYYEADDVIAYLVLKNKHLDNIIVSNDKDFLQLITPTTRVYQFTKKRLMDLERVKNEFGVLPENVIYYRSLIGDTSDELGGVKGIGPDTIKKITAFKEKVFDSFPDFWNSIEEVDVGKSKKLKLLKESRDDAMKMYQLMKLDEECLNQRAIELVKAQVDEQIKKSFSSTSFMIFCVKNKLNFQIPNPGVWVIPFVSLKKQIDINY